MKIRHKTRIKICGITRIEDALEAARLGADYLGFVFYPPSPRYIAPAGVREILRGLHAAGLERVPEAIGVFVDASPEEIVAVRAEARLDGAQFCGDESPEDVARTTPIRFRGMSLETLDRLGRYNAEAYLCDTHAPEQKGGTGRSYDYDTLQPYIYQYPIIIAGGLTPESVGGVISRLHPWGVDVSSALEARPGVKDLTRLRAFIAVVREAE
ncbi:TPA: N-(5'-phosphoribosyl)anthranilate isomerase [Candidatus Sumerlaeota bacterium]|jgi:phosphoribosylanthranilate isomerase|nr:N-(5'-phosphoribosyl)anthranilate isomerase [Candidatus Sumerlaeota bacterium]